MGVVLVDGDGRPVEDGFQIFPESVPAAGLFFRCARQWHRDPLSGALTGMNWPGVESIARMAGITITPELLDDMQCIEEGALGSQPNYPDIDALNIIRVEFDDG